jgi:hypothetical protein
MRAFSKKRPVGACTAFCRLNAPVMSIKVSSEVWRHSRHKSGNLLVLLALADHADDRGICWPGIPLLALEVRLSERHTRRCVGQLIASGEVEILPDRAPSGGTLYRIRVDRLGSENFSGGTSASDHVTPMSVTADADDQPPATPYIEEPSNKSSEHPSSKLNRSNSRNPREAKRLPIPDSIGLISSPKNGF